MRILLVEDNVDDALQLQGMLERHQQIRYQVAHVTHLRRARDLLRKNIFDLILLDLNLPDSRGLATVHQVRKSAPAVPLVILAELYEEPLAAAAMRAGARDYLFKGFLSEVALSRSLQHAAWNSSAAETAELAQGVLMIDEDTTAVIVLPGSGDDDDD